MITVQASKKDRFIGGTTSLGNQQKWYQNGHWIKSDYMGYEGLAEKLCSVLLSCSNAQNYCSYDICKIIEDEKFAGIGCISPSFIGEGVEHYPFFKLFKSEWVELATETFGLSVKEKILYFSNVVKAIWKVDILDDFMKMLAFDCIVLNEDRHLNNFGLLYDTNSNGYSFAPIFDNGLSLLSDLRDYHSDTSAEVDISRNRSRLFTPSFSKLASGVEEITSQPVLELDIDRFRTIVQGTDFSIYDKKYLLRSLDVLKIRLKESEGILWLRV